MRTKYSFTIKLLKSLIVFSIALFANARTTEAVPQKYIFIEFASKNQVGLGGPDVIPYNKPAMHNSYPFFNQYKGRLSLVAIAIQSPDHSYTNPKTKKHYTNQEFIDFATSYLGADIIFIEV